jgi:hypothetical protein
MINRIMERALATSSWVLNPGRLVDRFLDQLDKLRELILLPQADNSLEKETQVEPRLGQFGA